MAKRSPSSEIEELRDLIRARQLRATPARVAVLQILRASKLPLTHDEVVHKVGAQVRDRSTVYRALNQLAAVRLARRSDLGDRVWRFSVVDSERDHTSYRVDFVCCECGLVLDLTGIEIARARISVPRAVTRGQIEVRVIGPCNNCI